LARSGTVLRRLRRLICADGEAPPGDPCRLKDYEISSGDEMGEGTRMNGLIGAKPDRTGRRPDVEDAIASLVSQRGQKAALKLARAGLRLARRARSRKHFEFWTSVAVQIEANRFDGETERLLHEAGRLTKPDGANSALTGEGDLEKAQ
jgi:hypothetical protein